MDTNNINTFTSGNISNMTPAVTFGDENSSNNVVFNPASLIKESAKSTSFHASILTDAGVKPSQPISGSGNTANGSSSAANYGSAVCAESPFTIGQNIPPIHYTNCNVNAGKIVEYGILRNIDLQVSEAKNNLSVRAEAEKTKNKINASIEKDTLRIRIEFNTEGYLVLRHERICERDHIFPIIDHRPEIIEQYVSDGDPEDKMLHVRWVKRSHIKDMYFSVNCHPNNFKRELSALGVHIDRFKGIKSLIEDVIGFLVEEAADNVVVVPVKYGLFTRNGESVYIRPGDKKYKLWEEYKKKCVK